MPVLDQPRENSPAPTRNHYLLVRPEGSRGWKTHMFYFDTNCASYLCNWYSLPCKLCRLAENLGECCLVPYCVPGALVAMRTKIRTMGGISGTICKDCVAVSCCGPCAVCQMVRETQAMGLQSPLL